MNAKVTTALCLTLLLCASAVRAEDMQEQTGDMDAAMAEMTAKMEAYAKPSEGHQRLSALVGEWDCLVKHWMNPGDEPEVSAGTSTAEWIMSNHYIQQTFKGEAMGAPFEGMGITGYDNIAQQYNSIWLDTIGIGIMKSVGSFDDTNNAITEQGKLSCPLTGGPKDYKAVTTFVDDDHYTYEPYSEDENGNEFRAMLITYARKDSDQIAGNTQETDTVSGVLEN